MTRKDDIIKQYITPTIAGEIGVAIDCVVNTGLPWLQENLDGSTVDVFPLNYSGAIENTVRVYDKDVEVKD